MSDRRGTRRRPRKTKTIRTFTLDELGKEPLRVIGAVRKDGGCIVVDSEGKKRFSLWI